jgi:hypothetical protein
MTDPQPENNDQASRKLRATARRSNSDPAALNQETASQIFDFHARTILRNRP